MQSQNSGDLSQKALKLIRYLSFKMDCLREQEANPLTIDVAKAKENYDRLLVEFESKVENLTKTMPPVPVVVKKAKPKVMFKKDGSLSVAGENWVALLRQKGLPKDHKDPIEVIKEYKEPNPKSTQQVKDWLYTLGWKPRTYKYVRDKSPGKERKIEQVRKDGELCESVLDLVDKEPALKELEGMTILQHRLGILKNFFTMPDDHGMLPASAGGFTNTLRLQHRNPIVNLPGVDKPYGKEIRECIVAPEGKVLCGADVGSLEAKTKMHYMKPHDSDYVEEMSQPGFDEHLNLAQFAGAVTEEEISQHKDNKIDLTPIRKKYKATNYSAVYGVGKAKLARELGISVKEAGKLLTAYWQRNWSVKKVSEEQYVKKLKDGSMWLLNPLSGFYHSLRYEKDIFSTLNQSTGVYVFDAWVLHCRCMGIIIQGQIHDEIFFSCPQNNKKITEGLLHKAMEMTNGKLKLNVNISIDVKFGPTYASVH